MNLRHWTCGLALGACLALASGCNETSDEAQAGGSSGLFGRQRVTVPSGTMLQVQLAQTLSSETTRQGDAWRGTLVAPVIVEGREVLPAGSPVEGVVVGAAEARRGSRASLDLGVRAVRVGDRKLAIAGAAPPVIAGSPRARNLGAIAGGAAAGALLGRAIGGDGDDAAKGAIVGGAVAGGAVAASKGYQVILKEGTRLTFAIEQDVAVAVR